MANENPHGHCPHCGAPIYARGEPPRATYSCVCPRPGPAEALQGGKKVLTS